MTPTDVITAARDLYNATGDSFFTDTQMYNWVWQAEHELAKRAWLIETITTSSTVANTQNYAFPTNAIAVKRVLVNGKKLQHISFRDDDAITLSNATVTTTGNPIYYTMWNFSLYLRPTPDSIYTLTIYSYQTPQQSLVMAGGSLEVPELFHFDLVDYCLFRMFSKDKDATMATLHKQLWDSHVTEAIAYKNRLKRTDSYSTVQSEDNLPTTILGAS